MSSEEGQEWKERTDRLERKLEDICDELHKTNQSLEELISPALRGLIGVLQDRLPRPNS
jgi:hypothetical protein